MYCYLRMWTAIQTGLLICGYRSLPILKNHEWTSQQQQFGCGMLRAVPTASQPSLVVSVCPHDWNVRHRQAGSPHRAVAESNPGAREGEMRLRVRLSVADPKKCWESDDLPEGFGFRWELTLSGFNSQAGNQCWVPEIFPVVIDASGAPWNQRLPHESTIELWVVLLTAKPRLLTDGSKSTHDNTTATHSTNIDQHEQQRKQEQLSWLTIRQYDKNLHNR